MREKRDGMSSFFAYISRMKFIKRWGLMRNTYEENIQEHSTQVAMIAHNLALVENKFYGGNYDPNYIMVLAAYHEASEIITGDLPTPIKYYNPQIMKEYKKIENMASRKILKMLPEDLRDDYRDIIDQPNDNNHKIVKAADKIAAYIKCVEELTAGNREFIQAEKATKQAIDELDLKCVQYFMDTFMESYKLTLDELN